MFLLCADRSKNLSLHKAILNFLPPSRRKHHSLAAPRYCVRRKVAHRIFGIVALPLKRLWRFGKLFFLLINPQPPNSTPFTKTHLRPYKILKPNYTSGENLTRAANTRSPQSQNPGGRDQRAKKTETNERKKPPHPFGCGGFRPAGSAVKGER
jgi:hypothetical protein